MIISKLLNNNVVISEENHQFALNHLQNVLGSTIIDNNLKVKKQ